MYLSYIISVAFGVEAFLMAIYTRINAVTVHSNTF